MTDIGCYADYILLTSRYKAWPILLKVFLQLTLISTLLQSLCSQSPAGFVMQSENEFKLAKLSANIARTTATNQGGDHQWQKALTNPSTILLAAVLPARQQTPVYMFLPLIKDAYSAVWATSLTTEAPTA